MSPKLEDAFWRQDCRGPALSHTHHPAEDCNPQANQHANCPCRDCGLTPSRWAALVDPDSLPLELPQPTGVNCNSPLHKAISSKVDGEHAGWIACPECAVPVEPKLATGQLSGPIYGPGRGWTTPRMRNRWAGIAHRVYEREGGEYASR